MIRNRNAYLKNYRFNVIKKSGKKILTYTKRRYYRKPGPKDGWNGMRNRILKYLIKKGFFTVRDVYKYLGLRRQAVYYHLEILLEEELVVRVERGVYVVNKYMILSLDLLREKGDMLRLTVGDFCGRNSINSGFNDKGVCIDGADGDKVGIDGANGTSRDGRNGVCIDFLRLSNLAVGVYDNFKFDLSSGVYFAEGGDRDSNSMDRFVSLLEDMGLDIRRYFKRLRLGGRHCPYPVWVYVLKCVDVSIFEHEHKYTRGHRFGNYRG